MSLKPDEKCECTICGREAHYYNKLHREWFCPLVHKWHECPIHKVLYPGLAWIEHTVGVTLKDCQLQRRCTCYENDADLAGLFKFAKGNKELTKTLYNIALRVEKMFSIKREVTNLRESMEIKNRELDALHYVWCSGTCGGGVHRYDEMKHIELTEEIVKLAESNVKRLRTKLENLKYAKEHMEKN